MTIEKKIKALIDKYEDIINDLQDGRRNEKGISTANILRTGQIGAYGKAVCDLRDMLEGEE